jgi:pimeloyl-ACP methyl ester carboxylesterase
MIEFSDLRQLPKSPEAGAFAHVPDKVIVFIHGIFSSHVTFEPLVAGLVERAHDLVHYGMYYFDYEFYQTIPASGRELATTLSAAFPKQKPHVTLVGHSMGGLVARTALLQAGDLGMVKRLVMLGTPNHGALHTARMGLLAHLLREATDVLWTIFPRQATGIKELTKIGKTLKPLVSEGARLTQNVEYVTIPGLRFTQETGWMESPHGTSAALRALAISMEFLSMIPGMHAELRIPHDGIVEERCVRLSSEPDYFSERPAVGSGRRSPAPYLHITHPDYEDVDHVTVQHADRTIMLLAELLVAKDLETWRESLAVRGEFNLLP